MADRKVRWGVLGCANIAEVSFVPAVKESGGGELVAIGSRSEERSREFAEKHGFAKAYGNYQAVLEDPEVEAVYIPLPNTLHLEWIVKAAEAGKHVFCEKPLTMTADEARKAVEACERHGVLLLEAFVWRYHRQTRRIREVLDRGDIGNIRHTDARFHFKFNGPKDNIRLRPEVGGGALMDVGCYVLSWARWVMGEPPLEIAATSIMYELEGVDKTTVATLRFSKDRTANVSCSFGMVGGQGAVVYGDLGKLEVTQPFHPRQGGAKILLTRKGTTEEIPVDASVHPFTDAVTTFQECVVTGAPLPIPASDLIDQARTVEACRKAGRSGSWVQV